VSEAVAETARPEETVTGPAAQEPEPAQDGTGDVAAPVTEAAEPDHMGLLHELAAMVRDIPLNALQVGHVSELKAWLTSKGL
jgi:hypothetical protein